MVTASGDETTVLKVDGNFNVTGPLETFANAGGVHLARELLAEFAGNMAQALERRAPPAAAEILAAPQAAAESPGGSLLWRAFLQWLRQIFFAKRQRGSQ